MENIELFVQGEGIKDVVLIEIPYAGKVRDILKLARSKGLSGGDEEMIAIFLEDEENAIEPEITLKEAGIHHRKRIHLHRCHEILVTVNFNGQEKQRIFRPSSTIKRIKKWATGPDGFHMSELDASEHALQICGTDNRPDEDVHVGTLVVFPNCSVSFDLVPKKRVEG